MKNRNWVLLVLFLSTSVAQAQSSPSDDPEAHIFDPMVGEHRCVHHRTNYETRETQTYEANWSWVRDMRGHAIRDWGDNGSPNLTLRIYDPAQQQWHVWYFLGGAGYFAGHWVGGSDGDRLVFRYENVDYSERPVTSELVFSNVTSEGFDWQSTDIYNDTGERFVDWRITCRKVVG